MQTKIKKSIVKEDLNIMKLKRYTLSTPLICLMLISCGGGGGGSGGGALVQTPTPTYTEYVDFVNNGGTVPSVQGQIFRSKGGNQVYSNDDYYPDTEFDNFSSITLQYSVPDANGNQSISMSGRVDWDGDPFSGSDTITGTLDSNDNYDLFHDDHLAIVTISQDCTYGVRCTYLHTIGFVDFGELRTVEKTDYVTQLLQYRAYYTNGGVGYAEEKLGNYDFLAFVMGDQTWASDMPSSGSAIYNGFAQMLFSFQVTNPTDYYSLYERSKWYLNGTSTFTADFATRNFTGQLVFDYHAPAQQAAYGQTIDTDINDPLGWWFNLEGTISGTSFSGTTGLVDASEAWFETYPGWGEYTTSFSGNFYGPNATELGGIFTYSENVWYDDGVEVEYNGVGTFTGCQGC